MAALSSAGLSSAAPLPGTAGAAGTMSGGAAPRTQQAAVVIEGHHTEVLRTVYANAEMWVVTQVGRIGSVVRASRMEGASGDPIVVCRTLFGKRDDAMHDLFARALAERVIDATGNPLTLAFALKPDVDTAHLKAIIDFCCSLL